MMSNNKEGMYNIRHPTDQYIQIEASTEAFVKVIFTAAFAEASMEVNCEIFRRSKLIFIIYSHGSFRERFRESFRGSKSSSTKASVKAIYFHENFHESFREGFREPNLLPCKLPCKLLCKLPWKLPWKLPLLPRKIPRFHGSFHELPPKMQIVQMARHMVL